MVDSDCSGFIVRMPPPVLAPIIHQAADGESIAVGLVL
jgi:hypothetical protein